MKDTANIRVHGTTRKVPWEVFEQEEKAKLSQLPVQDFIFSSSQKAILNTNCHLSYKGVYYSAPYQYVGMELDVIEVNNLFKIYYQNTELAVHLLNTNDKGGYITDTTHYPTSKNITIREIQERQKTEMAEIGSGAASFYEAFISKEGQGKYEYRSITGILALRKKYDSKIINEACKRALHYNSLTYTTIKKICDKGLVALPVQASESYLNDKPTEVARDLAEYRVLCELGGLCNE